MSDEANTIQLGKPERSKGLAFRNAYSSVIAGVGNILPQQEELARPDLTDHTSDESLEKFKEYNTKTQLRANERRMWGYTIDGLARSILTGLTIAVGTTLMALSPVGPVATGFLAMAAVTGISLGVFYSLQQSATREQTDKGMDVSDFGNKRNAALIAQEIGKMLNERESKTQLQQNQTTDVLLAAQPANENRAPRTQLAASGERELQAKLAAHALQSEIA